MNRGTLILNGVAYGGSGGGSSVPIIDNLTSDDTDKALSVNQGKILKELVDNTKNTISNVYLNTRDYVIGDYCSYNNKLYKVIANCKGVTPPNTTYYEETTIAREQGGIRLGIDADGNYGYYKVGADTLTPFKSGIDTDIVRVKSIVTSPWRLTIDVNVNGEKQQIIYTDGMDRTTHNLGLVSIQNVTTTELTQLKIIFNKNCYAGSHNYAIIPRNANGDIVLAMPSYGSSAWVVALENLV